MHTELISTCLFSIEPSRLVFVGLRRNSRFSQIPYSNVALSVQSFGGILSFLAVQLAVLAVQKSWRSFALFCHLHFPFYDDNLVKKNVEMHFHIMRKKGTA